MSEREIIIKAPDEDSLPVVSVFYKRDVIEGDDAYSVMMHELTSLGVTDQLKTPKQAGELVALIARTCAHVLSIENGNVNFSDQYLAEISEVFQTELIEESYDKQS